MRSFSTQSIFKGSIITLISRVLARLLRFALIIIITSKLGVSYQTDAFFATQTIFLLFLFIGDSVLNYTFLPVFVDYKKNNSEEEAWAVANSVFTLTNIILIAVSGAIFMLAPYIAEILVPGLSKEGISLAAFLLRIISVVPVLSGLSAFFSAVLYSYRSFLTPAVTFLFYGSTTIIVTLLFVDKYGIVTVPVGAVIGIGIHTFLLFYFLKRHGRTFRLSLDFSHPGVKKTAKLMGPKLLTVIFSRVNLMVDIFFVSGLGAGYVSCLIYAYRLIQIPFAMLIGVLGRTFMPLLSEQGSGGNYDKIQEFISRSLRTISFVMLPLSIVLFVFRVPLISFLFQRGPFDINDTYLTSTAFMFYDLGLLSFSFSIVLMGAFHALQDSMTPLKIGMLCFVSNILLDIILIRWLGIGGIALATSLIATLNVTLLLIFLRRKIGNLGASRILPSFLRILIASGLMGIAVYFISNYFQGELVANKIFNMMGFALLSFVLYLAACMLFKVEECKNAYRFIERKLST